MSKTLVVGGSPGELRKILEAAGFQVEEAAQGEIPELKVDETLSLTGFTYQSLFQSAFDMIFSHEIFPDGEYGSFTEVNELACERLGYTRQELLGMRPQDVLDPKIVDLERDNSKRLTKHRQGSFDRVLVARDGSRIPVEINTRVLKLQDRDFALSIVRDVSEQKRIESELRENERRYRSLFENMTDAFALHDVVLDAEGKPADYIYREVNEAFEKMTGLERGKILGKGVREVLAAAPEELDRWVARFGEVALSGRDDRFEDYSPALERWYSIHAYSPREGQFAVIFDDITRQKKVERQLLEFGERLKLALESSREGLWDWNLSSGEVYFSSAWKSILGTQEIAPEYQSWESRLHPEDRTEVIAGLTAHLEGATENWSQEHRLRSARGDWKWVMGRGKVVSRDEEGRPLRMLGTLTDISERKAAEELLREQKSLLDSIFNDAEALIFVVDKDPDGDFRYRSFNRALERAYGTPREDWVGHSPAELKPMISEELAEHFTRRYALCAEAGRVISYDERVQVGSEFRWWHTTLSPIKDEKGQVFRIIGTAVDISERRAYEEELSREKERAEAYLQLVGVIIIALNTRGDIMLINRKGCDLLGYEREELIGRNWFEEFIPAEEGPAVKKTFHRLMAGEIEPVEYFRNTVVTREGERREIAWHNTAIREPAGNISGTLSTGEDITERLRAEQRLRESEEQYRRLTEAAPAIISRYLISETPKCEFISSGAKDITGYDPQEYYDDAELAWRIVHPEDRERIRSVLSGQRDAAHSTTYRILRKDGKQAWLESRLRLLDGEEGSPAILESYNVDVTEQKLAQIELDKAINTITLLKERLEAENINLRGELRMSHAHGEMVGESEVLKRVLRQAEQVAGTDSTVLILGQTGTGKELLARAIHRMSSRAEKPLIMVNCAAIPDSLIENELFGSEKGAFTGSHARQIGRFEAAHGGTLVLDEIGDLSLELQAKLLRVLQDGRFERLGSTRSIQVDVRLIASTNADLERKIAEGSFRQDLFYRLNVFPITMPSLAERQEDIRLLTRAFVEEFAMKMGKPIEQISELSLRELEDHSWPGNVRELRNTVERAMIECTGNVLTIRVRPSAAVEGGGEAGRRLADVEKRHITEVLRDTRWKVRGEGGAAQILGMNPSTLESRMRKLGIKRPR